MCHVCHVFSLFDWRQVLDQRNMNDYAMKQSDFFKAFKAGGDRLGGRCQPLMLKVKDYPPEAAFAEEMPRHWQVTPLAPSAALPTCPSLPKRA